jgi:hypothetical protein
MRAALGLSLALLASSAYGQEAGSFLKIGVGARALGMGGAYTALADDAAAASWNAAGLSKLRATQLDAMHAEQFGTASFDFLGLAQPLPYGTLGVAGRRLSQQGLEGRDGSAAPTAGFAAADTAVDLTYGAPVYRGLRLGGGVTFVHSAIADVSARAWALHFGGLYEARTLGPGRPSLGVSVQNAGPGLRYAENLWPLPLTVAVGLAYRLPSGLTLAADFKRRPHGQSSEASVGTELQLVGGLYLRAGYAATRTESRTAGPSLFGGAAGGFGVALRRYTFDYALTPSSDLGSVHRLSLSARF